MYKRDTTVVVEPFTRQPDGQEVIIGKTGGGIFVSVPVEALEVLDQLSNGKSVGEAADSFEARHGEVPDLNEFLTLLEAKGLVKPVVGNDQRFGDNLGAAPTATTRLRYHFSNFPQSLANRIFGVPALCTYCFLIVLALTMMLNYPSLVSGPRDLYFPDHRTLTVSLLTLANYVALFVHEFAHLVAARALGINSRLGVGHRLWFLVAETDLTGLWTVPKRQRYLPLFAGMLTDAVSGALLVLLLFAGEHGWVGLGLFWKRVVRALVFTYFMRIIWQFFVFVRTDLYYVIANWLNCKNLLKDTEGFVQNQVARIITILRRVDQSAIPLSELRVIRAYAVIWVFGRIAALTGLFVVTIPVSLLYIRSLVTTFKTGYSASPRDFIDALLLANYVLIPIIIGMAMWIGGFVRRERTTT